MRTYKNRKKKMKPRKNRQRTRSKRQAELTRKLLKVKEDDRLITIDEKEREVYYGK